MHELSHVILHYDLIDRIIIDDFDDNMECHLESEANRLTRDLLIPKHAWRSSDARINKTEQSVHF